MPVIVTIEPKSVIEIGQPQSKYKKGQIIEALIQQGLRARLATESMLTGSRYISLDMEPKEPLKLVGTPNTYPEFPTIKAPPEKLSDIISSTRNTLASIEKFVTSEKLNQSIDDFSEMMKAGKDTMLRTKEVAKTAQQTLEVTKQTMETGKSAVDDGRRLINRVDRYIEPLAIKLLKSLQQLPDTINTIRVFVDYLSRHPEALLQGKGTGHGR